MQDHLHHGQFVKIRIEQTVYHAIFLSRATVIELPPLFKITRRTTKLQQPNWMVFCVHLQDLFDLGKLIYNICTGSICSQYLLFLQQSEKKISGGATIAFT
jgi:hypothetical protein